MTVTTKIMKGWPTAIVILATISVITAGALLAAQPGTLSANQEIPAAPTEPMAHLIIPEQGGRRIRVSWDPPEADRTVTGYTVRRSDGPHLRRRRDRHHPLGRRNTTGRVLRLHGDGPERRRRESALGDSLRHGARRPRRNRRNSLTRWPSPGLPIRPPESPSRGGQRQSPRPGTAKPHTP